MERKQLIAIMAAIISTSERVSKFENAAFVAVHLAIDILDEVDKLTPPGVKGA